ncbi:predicted protein [Uncinocarpus reesii 1704]|uniref:Uncharacterized protein n=1 Tax=Uncinocarpus reesii (strain UAMH 1704) TaxID=336963 RepID=C4JJU5_UNCRE|nr:uncharacterized protein UREG_01902 [Uncinocarpus reesii 1704]EEP77053.1 predicted protein [Uncinocarpus reesii 1704]
MVLKQKADPARRPHKKGDEDPGYGEWLPGGNFKIVFTQDSVDCSTGNAQTHKDHFHDESGVLQGSGSSHCHYQLSSSSPSLSADLATPAMAISIPAQMPLDAGSLGLLRSAPRFPPITKATLSELDLDRIMRNINLRVDVNFYRDLHFRPVEGEKGEERDRLARVYWEAIAIEIAIYAYHAATNNSECGEYGYRANNFQGFFEPRLPLMLETLKDVLWTLVPERDHQTIAENLDVPFIMQQIEKGVLNLVSLLEWLSALVKSHCAPMRDSLADQMVDEIREGNELRDPRRTVNGLTIMFGILESMKLDVANHQIRSFRLPLIDDTVRFLQSYFFHRLDENAMYVEEAKKWFHNALREQACLRRWTRGWTECNNVAAVCRGLTPLLSQSDSPAGFPATFKFTHCRLWMMRSEVQDSIAFELCKHVFDKTASNHIPHIPRSREVYSTLRSRLWSIVEGDRNGAIIDAQKWRNNISSIALEITRLISNLEASIKPGVTLDANVLSYVEGMLRSCFGRRSPLFEHYREVVSEQLEKATMAVIERYVGMSCLDMCDDQHLPQPEDYVQLGPNDIESIGKRLAHLCVLHWRVWGPILYFANSGQSGLDS